jgi:hypothetical protein
MPEEKREDATAKADEHWDEVDADGNGTISEVELATAIEAHGPPKKEE